MAFNFLKNIFKRKKTDEEKFLNEYVFNGLLDLNTGFDVPSIHYFSKEDFGIVVNRLEQYGIIILGIEPWLEGEFYDVISYEDYGFEPHNYEWVNKAMKDFGERNLSLQYSASYFFPNGIPETDSI